MSTTWRTWRSTYRGAEDNGKVRWKDNVLRGAVKSEVSGFIRLQHYGTGNSLSKYIYVDSFESTRWTSSGERVAKVVE